MEYLAGEQCSGNDRSHNLTAVLSVGSNRSDGLKRVISCLSALAREYHIMASTPPFGTDDIHRASLHPPLEMPRRYVNAVAVILIPSPPLAEASAERHCRQLKELERELGRRPEEKAQGKVSIDIDLVVYGGKILRPADYLRPYYHPRALML